MKKTSFFIFLFSVVCTLSYAQSIYSISLKNIDGDSVSLEQYSGKKVLFIVLPLNNTDSLFSQITRFQSRYGDSLRVIGLLSREDGYQEAHKPAVKAMYAGWNILLTEGLNTKKASGKDQSPLMQWLTDRTKNLHFDMDCRGVGQKFFVSESGGLYAVLGPRTSLDLPIIDKIVSAGSGR